MTQYTTIDERQLEDILHQYDIGSALSYQLLSGGSENTNYLLTTTTGKYVVSICEQKTQQQAEELADLLIHLAKHDFRSSVVILSKLEAPVIIWNQKPMMIKKYLEGHIVEDLSNDLLYKIGYELANLHLVEAPEYVPKQLNYGIEQFATVNEYAAQSAFAHWLREIESSISPFLALDLPQALIHSDVFWSNVIVTNDQSTVTIMDFEEASYYYRVFDIGMTIIGTCAADQIIDIDKGKQLLAGYQSVIALTDDEISSLKAFTIYAGAAMTFWRHQNFNHIKPDPAMFEHYKGLKVLVDYMLEQDDDCFFITE